MGEFVLTQPNMQIPTRGKPIYSINEANRWQWDEPLRTYITDHLVPALVAPSEVACSVANSSQKQPILVMDRHRSHSSEEIQAILEEHFEVIYTPPMSCVLNNPIESMWSLIKRHYQKNKLLADAMRNRTKDDYLQEAKQSVSAVVPLHQASCLKANYKYLLELHLLVLL